MSDKPRAEASLMTPDALQPFLPPRRPAEDPSRRPNPGSHYGSLSAAANRNVAEPFRNEPGLEPEPDPLSVSNKPASAPDPNDPQLVTCAFCQGKGVDPFGVMSSLSTCTSCSGSGVRIVPMPRCRCPFCRGSGSYKTFRCSVCKGAGWVAEPPGVKTVCSECDGKAYEANSGMPCLQCKGLGFTTTR